MKLTAISEDGVTVVEDKDKELDIEQMLSLFERLLFGMGYVIKEGSLVYRRDGE